MSQIIRERLPQQKGRDGVVWNNAPGALLTFPQFSDSWSDYPFLNWTPPESLFTAVIYCQLGVTLSPTSTLYRLVKNVAKSQYVARVRYILWCLYAT